LPESELRNQFESVNGAVGHVTAADWVMRSIGQQQVYRKDYSHITVPLLFLLELPRFPENYHPKSDEDRALIAQFVARGEVIVNRWIDKAKRNVRDVRVVDVPGGGHYLWITREPVVLREIHTFIASLPADHSR
jgi:hypothetical protein